jgi:hypothetical protein
MRTSHKEQAEKLRIQQILMARLFDSANWDFARYRSMTPDEINQASIPAESIPKTIKTQEEIDFESGMVEVEEYLAKFRQETGGEYTQ